MKVNNELWSVEVFVDLYEKIEDQPIYQRNRAWNASKKKLLIDSLLRKYDIPKIVLRKLNNNAMFDFQVIDGQQRLDAIWSYVDDEYSLGHHYEGSPTWVGKKYSQLRSSDRLRLLNSPLAVAVVADATDSQVRDQFTRLQMGSPLNQAELRNSIRSRIGSNIRTIAETHPFFENSPFKAERFNYHDLLAHLFCLEIHKFSTDLKAKQLREMYIDYKDAFPSALPPKVIRTLDYLQDMQSAVPKCISKKWGLVDIYQLVRRNAGKVPKADVLAQKSQDFEALRIKHNREPEKLLTGKRKDTDLYNYIMAFNFNGNASGNIDKRYKSIFKKLL